ncbi:MAG TPA: hypothetical protein VEC99_03645, partial [Clostridia bacterium]|nr:hypothetical protein [Clostridia bacterium]
VISLYGFSLVFLAMGFLAIWSRGESLPILLGVAVLILLFCAGNLSFSREWFAVGRVVGNSLGLRRQVQYALLLTRWLEMEAARHESLEGFWTDFAFAAQRLGFVSVRLTLADDQRVWDAPERTEKTYSIRHELQSGQHGILELVAPACPQNHECERPGQEVNQECLSRSGACLSNPQASEILGELLAEAWSKAARHYNLGHTGTLRFDTRNKARHSAVKGSWLKGYPVNRGPQPSR